MKVERPVGIRTYAVLGLLLAGILAAFLLRAHLSLSLLGVTAPVPVAAPIMALLGGTAAVYGIRGILSGEGRNRLIRNAAILAIGLAAWVFTAENAGPLHLPNLDGIALAGLAVLLLNTARIWMRGFYLAGRILRVAQFVGMAFAVRLVFALIEPAGIDTISLMTISIPIEWGTNAFWGLILVAVHAMLQTIGFYAFKGSRNSGKPSLIRSTALFLLGFLACWYVTHLRAAIAPLLAPNFNHYEWIILSIAFLVVAVPFYLAVKHDQETELAIQSHVQKLEVMAGSDLPALSQSISAYVDDGDKMPLACWLLAQTSASTSSGDRRRDAIAEFLNHSDDPPPPLLLRTEETTFRRRVRDVRLENVERIAAAFRQ